MASLRRLLARLVTMFRSEQADKELSREIRAHLQLLEDEFLSAGMTPQEAHTAARRAFGGVEQAREQQRDARSFVWLAGWSMDLKLGVRMLRKSPGLTVIAVVALMVAIGAGAAYLEFVNDFFRPTLSFPGGNRLVGLVHIDPAGGGADPRAMHQFSQWAPRVTTITHLGIAHASEQNLMGTDGVSEPVRGAAVSAAVLRAIPVPPLLGRHLTAADELPGAPPVVMLGEDLWRARFGGDPTLVGRTVTLSGEQTTVVGIMPAAFGFPINNNAWTPMRLRPSDFASGEGPAIRIVGQLAPDASLDDAQAELSAIAASAATDPTRPTTALVKPYVESIWTASNQVSQVRLLYGLNVFFLALVGVCATNVATLVFARTATREGEITIRTALGAGRARIVSQLVAEAFVLTLLAALAGLAGATLLLRKVRELWTAAQGSPMPFWWNEQLGTETLAYAVMLLAAASLIIGGIPAFKATGPQMQSRLKDAGASGSTMRFGKWWTGVVVGQVAVTVIFLMAVVAFALNGLSMGEKFGALNYPQGDYLTAYVEFDDGVAPARRLQTLNELAQRLDADPGVINSTYVNRLWNPEEFWLEFAQPDVAVSARPPGDVLWVGSARIADNYFETFGQQLVSGRTFTASEIASGAAVAVVDQTFVRLVLGGRNPLGLQVRQPVTDSSATPGPWHEIVGVVTDLSVSPHKTTEHASLYRPLTAGNADLTRVVVHSRAVDVAARLRAAAFAADPGLRLAEVMTMDQVIDAEVRTFRFFTIAVSIIAGVALLLSTAGIYALVSYTLSRRVREIGIRMALGAGQKQVVAGTLSPIFRHIATGIVLGSLPGAGLVLLQSEAAVGGSWTPAIAAAGVALFVIGVAVLSCVPLVRRTLRIQPTDALRNS
jgi:putative ABC transport system permease protein